MKNNNAYSYKWYSFGCKDATYLGVKKQYGKLKFSEKFLLSFHMLICNMCKRFNKQVLLIDNLLKQLENNSKLELSKEKKDAINQEVTKNLR
ncbi:MAG: hypothetical protein JSU07_08335 [Bacteroidetes bacterium]|nr:hypothetical protein [Bacteroidota bacterium]